MITIYARILITLVLFLATGTAHAEVDKIWIGLHDGHGICPA